MSSSGVGEPFGLGAVGVEGTGVLLPGGIIPGKELFCGGGLVFGLVPMLGLLVDPGVETPGIAEG
jgi:hypothetical protein